MIGLVDSWHSDDDSDFQSMFEKTTASWPADYFDRNVLCINTVERSQSLDNYSLLFLCKASGSFTWKLEAYFHRHSGSR